MMTIQEKIINEVKNDYRELKYKITYQDDIPNTMVGFYTNTPLFVVNFSDSSINFEMLYNNEIYKKYIKPYINEQEKFLIESSGVNFNYILHRSMIQKLLPKIIISIKKYYILHRMESIDYDFKYRR